MPCRPNNPFGGVFGEMEDDPSRNGRSNPEEELKKIQCDCLVKKRPRTRFPDIAGNVEAKDELLEVARGATTPEIYKLFGAHLPRGIMMTGEPGCGKTYMTGALCNELDAPFYHVQVGNVVTKWFGESEKNLARIFEHAEKYCQGLIDIDEDGKCTFADTATFIATREQELIDEIEGEVTNRDRIRIRRQIQEELATREGERQNRHAVIFFDEIDALGSTRDNTPFQGGVSNRIVSVLLEHMDGLESESGILVVGSTNRPESVDPALRRAGRFDRLIKIKKPDFEARKQLFEIHTRKAEEEAGREFFQIDVEKLANATKNLVGADVAEIIRKACQERAKKYRDTPEEERDALLTITTKDLLAVISKYRTNLRKKDPDAKGAVGFKKKSKSTEFVEEYPLDDDDEIEEEEDAPEEDPDRELEPFEDN